MSVFRKKDSNRRVKNFIHASSRTFQNVFPENHFLSGIFRRRFFKNGLDSLYLWDVHMREYVNDPMNRVPQTPKDRTSTRGNLAKELTKLQMSWKVICKGWRFLKYTHVKVTFECYRENGECDVESGWMFFKNPNEIKLPDELKDQMKVESGRKQSHEQ